MKKICFLIIAFVTLTLNAQQRELLFTIDGIDSVYTDEFMRSFKQNNNNDYSEDALRDYLDLYINYKLKLLDAKSEGFYENPLILKQVDDFKNSLFQPKINDSKVIDSLVKQAYERQDTMIRASHCLIHIPADASLEDIETLRAKAEMIYNKALAGEDFDSLVIKYSDDPSATSPTAPNYGDLGYFTSMTMVYPFEEACYNMVAGNQKYSLARTRFGFHIIKITDVKQTDIFAYTLRHIFISTQSHSDSVAHDMINKAYEELQTQSFDSVALRYSDDKISARNGGMLSQQRCNVLPAEYVERMLSMKKSETSQPFKTRYGWHIIRFLNSTPIPEWEFQRNEIRDRIMKDERSHISVESYIERAKEEYNFIIDSAAVSKLNKIVTDSVFNASWQRPDNMSAYDDIIISFGDTSLVQYDLLAYIYENQTKQPTRNMTLYLYDMTDRLSDKAILEYCKDHIADKDTEMQMTIRDYMDGEIIFAITDKRVWTYSLNDTIGLQAFYEANKTNYMYSDRVDAVIWKIDTTLDAEKTAKKILKYKKKGVSDDDIKDLLNKKETNKVSYHWSKFEKGADNIIDKNIFESDFLVKTKKFPTYVIDRTSIKNRNCIIYVNDVLAPSVKPFDACKGLCTSDYQVLLEKQWLEDMHRRYHVLINEQAFKSLIK